MRAATIDQLMPSFKACSVENGAGNNCDALIAVLNETGHSAYALAVALYAPNCGHSCRRLDATDTQFTNTPGDTRLVVPTLLSNSYLTLTNLNDITILLERGCQLDGSIHGCQYYQQLGGSYSEAERRTAKQADFQRFKTGMDKEEAKARQANNSGSGFMSSLADALTQVQQSTPSSMPYPATAVPSRPAYQSNVSVNGQSESSPAIASSTTTKESYDPNRHYSGPNANEVSWLISQSSGWSCPTSSTASVSWQPPLQQVCMRDNYIIAAVALAYGAECESRLGRTAEASKDAESMTENIGYAKKLCSHAPAVGPGPQCSTIHLVPCP